MSRQIADERAARVLVYYLKMLWERSGLEWTADNESEVRGIVEDLLTAVETK